MKNNRTKSNAEATHENEILAKLHKMESKAEIENFMNSTENTFEKIVAFDYLQTF